MREIIYNSIDYANFVETLASKMNAKVKNNLLKIPQSFGEGFIWAENFDNGISFFSSEICFNHDIVLQRVAGENAYLILHFHEAMDDADDAAKNKNWPAGLRKNAAFLSNTFLGSEDVFPQGFRLRSCSILFDKKNLFKIFDNKVADNFISFYFSEYFKNKKIEPVDATYRSIMNELVKENISHPFRHLFIQNRIMLLIERFVMNFLQKEQQNTAPAKLSEEEINRLMKVEALLVKDFSESPPVIEALSRMSAMSPTKLKKDFRALYNMPIYEYYQKHRMVFAKNILLQNKHSIAEVGRMVGYTNLGHFAASFKKAFNILPGKVSREGSVQVNPGEIFQEE